MERRAHQRGWKKDVPQEYCDTYEYRAPVVETLALQTLEGVHNHHNQAGNVAQVKYQLRP
jgi:hypothetical protein